MSLQPRVALAAVAASLALAGCGGGGDASPAVTQVAIMDFTFRPARIEVGVGGKVTWKNLDKAKHTATAKEGSAAQFDTGTISKGASRVVAFKRKGTYSYLCSFHPFMEGTVEVR